MVVWGRAWCGGHGGQCRELGWHGAWQLLYSDPVAGLHARVLRVVEDMGGGDKGAVVEVLCVGDKGNSEGSDEEVGDEEGY